MTLIGPQLFTMMLFSIGACIRLYPLRGELKLKPKRVVGVYALFFFVQAMAFIALRERFSASYTGNQIFTFFCSIVTMLIPVFLTKASIFQHIFLYSVVFCYALVVFGAGNYIERAFGAAFAEHRPYIICVGVVAVLSIPLLPLTLKGLNKLFTLLPGNRSLVWRYIWIIPAVFMALCLISANVFMDESVVISSVFVVARIIAGIGMVATCFLLARALKQEADGARIQEREQTVEKLLDLQRSQYERAMEIAEQDKNERHDQRHHIAIMKSYAESGDNESLFAYIDELTEAKPVLAHKRYCDHYAANTVIAHYASIAEAEGVRIYISPDIPQCVKPIHDSDLCIVLGNLLENAIEACSLVDNGEKSIHLSCGVQTGKLCITLDNSFNGELRKDGETFLSVKRDGAGIGLASVAAVAAKYKGGAWFEAEGNTFLSSVVLELDIPSVNSN